uniref:Uncharacterized protein n=1 Tax=Clastoptera arizonana TaxID=38151 RepID=A0A1B6DUS2_9HEMI
MLMLVQVLVFAIFLLNKNTCGNQPGLKENQEWNKVAHLFHSINIQMRPVFREGNETAGELVLKRMEEAHEGLRRFKIFLDQLDLKQYHRILSVVKFILLRGAKQFDAIKYSSGDLKIKYFWEKEKVKEFRKWYKEIKHIVADIREHAERRNVNLDDDR